MPDEYPGDNAPPSQDQSTPFTAPPDEPGEIGWPANAEEPGDPSLPEPGAGGPASSEPPAPAVDVEEVVDAEIVEDMVDQAIDPPADVDTDPEPASDEAAPEQPEQ